MRLSQLKREVEGRSLAMGPRLRVRSHALVKGRLAHSSNVSRVSAIDASRMSSISSISSSVETNGGAST